MNEIATSSIYGLSTSALSSPSHDRLRMRVGAIAALVAVVAAVTVAAAAVAGVTGTNIPAGRFAAADGSPAAAAVFFYSRGAGVLAGPGHAAARPVNSWKGVPDASKGRVNVVG